MTTPEIPDYPPITTVAKVKESLAIPVDDTRDDVFISDQIDAVTAMMIDQWGRTPTPVYDVDLTTITGWQWRADWVSGCRMLTARLVRRRNSPAGVDSIGDLGAVYIQRNDPDIADLLQIGKALGPQVG